MEIDKNPINIDHMYFATVRESNHYIILVIVYFDLLSQLVSRNIQFAMLR